MRTAAHVFPFFHLPNPLLCGPTADVVLPIVYEACTSDQSAAIFFMAFTLLSLAVDTLCVAARKFPQLLFGSSEAAVLRVADTMLGYVWKNTEHPEEVRQTRARVIFLPLS